MGEAESNYRKYSYTCIQALSLCINLYNYWCMCLIFFILAIAGMFYTEYDLSCSVCILFIIWTMLLCTVRFFFAGQQLFVCNISNLFQF